MTERHNPTGGQESGEIGIAVATSGAKVDGLCAQVCSELAVGGRMRG